MTSIALLGHLGTSQLAGSAFAGVVTAISSVVLWQGFGDALIALSSQAVGASNPKLSSIWLQTSILCITLTSLPIALIWLFTEPILSLVSDDKEMLHYAGLYARYSAIWLVPDACTGAFSQWLNGLQLVKPTLPINFMLVGYNFGANYLLIHGWGDWSGLGFIGSPIAVATTKILRGVLLVLYICTYRKLHLPYWTPFTWKAFSVKRIKTFMAQALPAAAVGLVEQAQFVLITIMVESIGENQLAAHSGMLNIFQLVTCGMYGLSDAGASTVGMLLGKGESTEAKKAGTALLSLMMCMSTVVAGGFIGTHNFIGNIFTDDEEVLDYTKSLALILSAAYFLLSLTFSCFGTLQGQGRPHVAAICMFIGLWGLSVPLAFVFGIKLDIGLVGVWWGLVVGYSFMTFCMIYFVVKSDWATLSKRAMERSEKEKGGEGGEEIVGVVGDEMEEEEEK
eukprot:CAMPEP_0118650236 /NCGR_PEP_ID=MMETSP0785-20121206/10138_1 /TAXON_ID=91992 /ORGANISM="Bolidomonas pacifica, Strain CCMP 1866" /LENGTH=450 /DNA_ID=CAMNT_0006542595 /DNA_START=277 /DNA_END=1626 /DNA_ORIENTATION=-